MATGSTAPPPMPADEYAALIERQLGSARRQVKVTDLLSRSMLLIIGILAFLFGVSLVDHWLFDLGSWGRAAALIALLSGVVTYLLRFILPLVVRSINPVFAARAIERNEPTLKNSLINFLTFRTDTRVSQNAVFLALQRKAATDLATVSIDDAVDHSATLKIGYVLATVVTLLGVYKILSPKDPFQSISRVAAPWKDIERPTRAQIFIVQEYHRATANGPILSSVPPGERPAYQGHFVTIGTGISGIGRDAPVTLQYASLDGQVVDQTLPMEWNEDTRQYAATLPPTTSGIQFSLTYSIQAGDIVSQQYVLEVTPTPVITVQRVDYEFPAYTRLPTQTIVGNPHIQAVEGTQITIHAQANQPIKSAVIELFSNAPETAGSPRAMRSDQDRCVGKFRLPNNREGELQLHEYGIRFHNLDGESNPEVIRYPIDVLRDLAPEIEILNPKSREIELPEDGTQEVEIRAIDPDYGLCRIRLRATAGNDSILSRDLIDDATGRTGQVLANYQFIPRKLGLRTGDRVTLWATGEDNRTDSRTGTPAPNTRTTPRLFILITPPVQTTGLPPDTPQQADTDSPEEKSEKTEEPSGGQEGGDGSDSSSTTDAESATSQPSDTQPETTDSDTSSDGSNQPSDTPGQEGDSSGESDSPGSATPDSQQESPADSSESPRPDEETESGSGDNPSPTKATEPGDSSNGAGKGRENADGPQPASHDGEVIERVLDYLREETESNTETDRSSAAENASPEAEPPSESASNSRDAAGSESLPEQPSSPDQTDPQANGSAQPEEDGSLQSPANRAPADESSPSGGDRTNNSQQPTQDSDGANSTRPQTGDKGAAKQPRSNQTDPRDSLPSENDPDAAQSATKPLEQTENDQPSRPGQGNSDAQNQQSPDPSSPTDAPHSDVSKSGQEQKSDVPTETGQSPQPLEKTQEKQSDLEQTDATQKNQANEGSETADAKKPSTKEQASDESAAQSNQSKSEPDQKDQVAGTAAQGQSNRSTANPQGGGIPSDSDNATGSAQSEVRDGDKPNLEHARKATDLVLEKLADQEDNPDPKLLKKLNWDAEDVKQFVHRWKQLKQNAATPTGRHELQQALRSLGLKPQGTRVKQQDARKTRVRNLNDVGSRFAPPPGLRKRFNAYKRSVARTPDESP